MAANKRRRSEDIIAVDRLSDLPDEVLGHILSFLPTKKGVQTSVLSKRWKGVFSLATGLEFNDCHKATPFINFVDRVLSLHKVSIGRFKLNFRSMDQSDVSCVNAWIASALSLRAQELDLVLRYQMDDMTQHKLFSSCMISVLRLEYCYDLAILKVPMSVCLSSLSVLELVNIIFPDVDSTKRLFLGCSSLKDLTMFNCKWMDGEVYDVYCAKLRNLRIGFGYHKYRETPTIVLDLPDMVYFKCFSAPWELYQMKNRDLICTAELHLLVPYEALHRKGLIQLIRELSNFKVLRLLGNSLEAISRIKPSELPTFVTLSRLEVGTSCGYKRRGWRRLPKLIARSPMLETLVFKEGLDTCYNDLAFFLEEQKTPFSTNHITIQVDRYRGSKKEWRMVKLFLDSAAFNVKQLIVNNAKI
ncbi:hypothetical protein Droror1_Dr00014902 [Drosera rotundifolia]